MTGAGERLVFQSSNSSRLLSAVLGCMLSGFVERVCPSRQQRQLTDGTRDEREPGFTEWSAASGEELGESPAECCHVGVDGDEVGFGCHGEQFGCTCHEADNLAGLPGKVDDFAQCGDGLRR